MLSVSGEVLPFVKPLPSIQIRLNFNFPGTLTVEDVYQNREKFAGLVREVAAPDVGKMGIEILSFVIKDVTDDVNYLSSIGRAQTAIVKKDAAIGVAEAYRDSGIVVGTILFWNKNRLNLPLCHFSRIVAS